MNGVHSTISLETGEWGWLAGNNLQMSRSWSRYLTLKSSIQYPNHISWPSSGGQKFPDLWSDHREQERADQVAGGAAQVQCTVLYCTVLYCTVLRSLGCQCTSPRLNLTTTDQNILKKSEAKQLGQYHLQVDNYKTLDTLNIQRNTCILNYGVFAGNVQW